MMGTWNMQIPDPVFVSKKPFAIKCPKCSLRFEIGSYQGVNHEKPDQMEKDYQRHFVDAHLHDEV